MNDFNDYLNEMMFDQSTDRDIERLFDGSLDSSSDLASVVDLVESLRAEASTALDEETVATFVQSASAAAGRQRAIDGTVAAAMPTEESERGPLLVSLRRRVAAIAVAAALFVGGMSGMAIAADRAKPGDALYGIDRALEAVGIGNGKTAERLIEVQALFDAGDIPRGLQHVAEAVDNHDSDYSSASAALSEAAARVSSGGSVQSAATREKVAGLLSYLKGTGDIDGREVAELARGIGRSDDRPNTPPAGTPRSDPGPSDKNPVDPPGRPDFAPGSPTPPSQRP